MAEHDSYESQTFSNFSDTMQQINQSHELLYFQDQRCSAAPAEIQHTQMLENQMSNQCPPRQPSMPTPGYIQSLPFARLDELTYQQHLSMNPYTTTHPWAMQILQTLNSTCGRL